MDDPRVLAALACLDMALRKKVSRRLSTAEGCVILLQAGSRDSHAVGRAAADIVLVAAPLIFNDSNLLGAEQWSRR